MSDPIEGRLQRIEDKLDRLHSLTESIARVEERQESQSADARRLHKRADGIEGRLKTLETRTGWLPGVERFFWMGVAAVVAAAGTWFGRSGG